MAAVLPPFSAGSQARDLPWARLVLFVGLAVTCTLAIFGADMAPHVEREPDLERLLRGMGFIKVGLVAVAVALVFWRLAHPVGRSVSLLYLSGLWLAAGASVLICQLALVPLAACVFHAGVLAVLVALWRDQHSSTRRGAS